MGGLKKYKKKHYTNPESSHIVLQRLASGIKMLQLLPPFSLVPTAFVVSSSPQWSVPFSHQNAAMDGHKSTLAVEAEKQCIHNASSRLRMDTACESFFRAFVVLDSFGLYMLADPVSFSNYVYTVLSLRAFESIVARSRFRISKLFNALYAKGT